MDLTSNFDSKFRIFPNISKFGQFNFNPVSIFGQIVTLFQIFDYISKKSHQKFRAQAVPEQVLHCTD